MRYKDMRRILHAISTLLLMMLPMSLPAETVSQKEASKIAHIFFNEANGEVVSKPKLVYNGKRLTTNRLFSPFYVYNHPKGGFVIISADNKAFPILGYSLHSNFDPEKLDSASSARLAEYARDIEYIRHDGRVPDEAIAAWIGMPDFIYSVLNPTHETILYAPLNEEEHPDWRMLATATEFPEIGEIVEEEFARRTTRTGSPSSIDSIEPEEEKAKLRPVGGGHFEALIPEGVTMVRLYNLSGSMVRQLTFRNTDTAVFDLDGEPRGFYFALINGVSGRPYGFKIYK